MTYEDIGAKFGVTKQAVEQALRPFRDMMSANGSLQTFEGNYSKILSLGKFKLMEEIFKQDKLDKASINNLAYAFDKIAHHHNLETGKATQHIAYKDVSRDVSKVNTALTRLLKEHPELEALED
jgi:hypothetical protein